MSGNLHGIGLTSRADGDPPGCCFQTTILASEIAILLVQSRIFPSQNQHFASWNMSSNHPFPVKSHVFCHKFFFFSVVKHPFLRTSWTPRHILGAGWHLQGRRRKVGLLRAHCPGDSDGIEFRGRDTRMFVYIYMRIYGNIREHIGLLYIYICI